MYPKVEKAENELFDLVVKFAFFYITDTEYSDGSVRPTPVCLYVRNEFELDKISFRDKRHWSVLEMLCEEFDNLAYIKVGNNKIKLVPKVKGPVEDIIRTAYERISHWYGQKLSFEHDYDGNLVDIISIGLLNYKDALLIERIDEIKKEIANSKSKDASGLVEKMQQAYKLRHDIAQIIDEITNKNNIMDDNNVTTKIEFITPAVACEYLRHNKSNRPLNKQHVDFLARQMREGKWQLNGEGIMFDKDGCLANGQHRLTACVRADVGFYSVVIRGISKDSFATFDQCRNRSYSDVFNLAGIPNANQVSSVVGRYLQFHRGLSAFNDANGSNGNVAKGSNRLSKQEMLDLFEKFPDIFVWANKVASRAYDKCIRVMTKAEAGGLIAFLVIDLHHNEETVEAFIAELFQGKSKFKCVESMHKKLANSQISSMKMSSQLKTNLLAKVWNNYIQGKDTKVLKWSQDEGKIQFK